MAGINLFSRLSTITCRGYVAVDVPFLFCHTPNMNKAVRFEGEGLGGVIVGDDLSPQKDHKAPPLFLAYDAPELQESALLGVMRDIIRISRRKRRISQKEVRGNVIKIG